MCPILGHWTPPVQSLGWPPWTLVTPPHTCAGLLLGGGRCFKPKTSGKTVLSYHTMKYKFNCISLVKFINFRVWYDNNEDFHAWGAVHFFFATAHQSAKICQYVWLRSPQCNGLTHIYHSIGPSAGSSSVTHNGSDITTLESFIQWLPAHRTRQYNSTYHCQ